MNRVQRHEELEVYQAAFALQQSVFAVSQDWPKAETYSLTDQVRRSSRSIGANIAEAWAKRRYAAYFASKLTDADGEQNETRHWLATAHTCGYISEQVYNELDTNCRRIGAMLGKMITTASDWTIRPSTV